MTTYRSVSRSAGHKQRGILALQYLISNLSIHRRLSDFVAVQKVTRFVPLSSRLLLIIRGRIQKRKGDSSRRTRRNSRGMRMGMRFDEEIQAGDIDFIPVQKTLTLPSRIRTRMTRCRIIWRIRFLSFEKKGVKAFAIVISYIIHSIPNHPIHQGLFPLFSRIAPPKCASTKSFSDEDAIHLCGALILPLWNHHELNYGKPFPRCQGIPMSRSIERG